MTIYLSGCVAPSLLPHAGRPELGVLVQPDTAQYVRHVDAFSSWAVDNGCFAKGARFDAHSWFAWLETLPAGMLFAAAPDVVGDPVATWERSRP